MSFPAGLCRTANADRPQGGNELIPSLSTRLNVPLSLLAVVLVFATSAAAELPPIPPPPQVDTVPLPPPLQSGTPLEPQVRILQTPKERVYEYRRNGRLVMVRVQPRFGPPYYFVDSNGDGSLDYHPGEPVQADINQWILFTW